MDDAEKKSLEEMLDSAFEDVRSESPSSRFTENVMAGIEAMQREKVTTYQPIIPKRVLITCSVILVVSIVFFTAKADLTSSTWFSGLEVSQYTTKITLPELKFPVSNTILYGIIAFGFMVFVQTTLLKGYFDKRLA